MTLEIKKSSYSPQNPPQKAPETYYEVYTIGKGINLCSGRLEGRLSRLPLQETRQVIPGPRTLPARPQVDPAVAG